MSIPSIPTYWIYWESSTVNYSLICFVVNFVINLFLFQQTVINMK